MCVCGALSLNYRSKNESKIIIKWNPCNCNGNLCGQKWCSDQIFDGESVSSRTRDGINVSNLQKSLFKHDLCMIVSGVPILTESRNSNSNKKEGKKAKQNKRMHMHVWERIRINFIIMYSIFSFILPPIINTPRSVTWTAFSRLITCILICAHSTHWPLAMDQNQALAACSKCCV